jgi:hypothetical protein
VKTNETHGLSPGHSAGQILVRSIESVSQTRLLPFSGDGSLTVNCLPGLPSKNFPWPRRSAYRHVRHDDPGGLVPAHHRMYQPLSSGETNQCATLLAQHLRDLESRLTVVRDQRIARAAAE